MDKLNLVIMGKTGAGKSTLINSILQENVASEGKGRAVTKECKVYRKKMTISLCDDKAMGATRMVAKEICLLDTVGLEIESEATKQTLLDTKRFIQNAQSNQKRNDSTLVWFCINYRCSRSEHFETDLIRRFSREYEVPFVVVVTQCLTEEKGALEAELESELPEYPVARILARDFKSKGGIIPSFGVDELLRKTILEYGKMELKERRKTLEEILAGSKRLREWNVKGKRCISSYVSQAESAYLLPIVNKHVIHGLGFAMAAALNQIAGISDSLTFINEIYTLTPIGSFDGLLMTRPMGTAREAANYIQSLGTVYLNTLLRVRTQLSDSEVKSKTMIIKAIQTQAKFELEE